MSIWDQYKSLSGYNMLHSFLNPGDAYDAAAKEAEKGWQESRGYQLPFQQAGAGEIPRLQGAAGTLMDPEALENKWASGYEMSPYAKDELGRSRDIGMESASAMGLSGSSAALENLQRTGSSIMRADRQQYLNDLIQKYLAGVGVSQNLFGTGAQAGANLGSGALRTGEDIATAKYGEMAAPGELFGKLLGMGAGVAGTALGGPIGGAIANRFVGSYQGQPSQPLTGGMLYGS